MASCARSPATCHDMNLDPCCLQPSDERYTSDGTPNPLAPSACPLMFGGALVARPEAAPLWPVGSKQALQIQKKKKASPLSPLPGPLPHQPLPRHSLHPRSPDLPLFLAPAHLISLSVLPSVSDSHTRAESGRGCKLQVAELVPTTHARARSPRHATATAQA